MINAVPRGIFTSVTRPRGATTPLTRKSRGFKVIDFGKPSQASRGKILRGKMPRLRGLDQGTLS